MCDIEVIRDRACDCCLLSQPSPAYLAQPAVVARRHFTVSNDYLPYFIVKVYCNILHRSGNRVLNTVPRVREVPILPLSITPVLLLSDCDGRHRAWLESGRVGNVQRSGKSTSMRNGLKGRLRFYQTSVHPNGAYHRQEETMLGFHISCLIICRWHRYCSS